jgi:hypothetical protein
MNYKGSIVTAAVLSMAFVLLSAMVQPVAAEISDDAAKAAIKAKLDDGGISDAKIEVGNDTATGGDKFLIVSYKTLAGSTDGMATEMDTILGAFIEKVKNGWECDSMAAIIGTRNGGIAGTWYCDKEWKDQYFRGNLTMDDLSSMAISTLEPWPS